MGIETINESIRPITNLALIGDNDVSQIADLATNIMAGYDIKVNSMGSVEDILASTISRSNVNVVEMAESYKMAAGYMRMAGKTIEESSGHKIGAFTGNWWAAFFSNMGSAASARHGVYQPDVYSYSDARQDDTRDAIITLARKDSQARINSAFAELGKSRSDVEIGALLENLQSKFGQDHSTLDKSLFTVGKNGDNPKIQNLKEQMAQALIDVVHDFDASWNG